MKTAADDSWLPPDEGLGTACDSCGRETLSDRPGVPTENYRVHDHIWQQVQPARHLCIGCAERRLGRTLNRHDFPDVPVNDPSIQRTDHAWSWRTPRLQDRLTREAGGRQVTVIGKLAHHKPNDPARPPPAPPGCDQSQAQAAATGFPAAGGLTPDPAASGPRRHTHEPDQTWTADGLRAHMAYIHRHPLPPALNMDDMTATHHGEHTQPAPAQLQHLIHAAAIGGHPRSRPAPVQPPGPGHDPDPRILEGPDR